jgi:hypothetical protein
MEVEAEMAKLGKFQEYLGKDDKIVFHDLLDQCKIYSSFASGMTYSIKEVPLLVSILFGQHKRIMELEKKLETLESSTMKNPANGLGGDSRDHFRKERTLS